MCAHRLIGCGLTVVCACHRLTEERDKAQALALSNARLLGELESFKRHVSLIESHSNSWREHATNVIQSGLIDNRYIPEPGTHSERPNAHRAACSPDFPATHACTPPPPPPMMWGLRPVMMGHPGMGYMPHMMQYPATSPPYNMQPMQGVSGSTRSSNSVSDLS